MRLWRTFGARGLYKRILPERPTQGDIESVVRRSYFETLMILSLENTG